MTKTTTARSAETCPHADRPWRCTVCCVAQLRRSLPALDRAVTVRDKSLGGEYVSGGAPSWEPISLSAMALLQDIERRGGLNGTEHALAVDTGTDLRAVQRRVRQWASRAALILGEAVAPYPLLWDGTKPDGKPGLVPVPCPVVDQDGDCDAPLKVHREQDPDRPDFARPSRIVCDADDDHAWPLAFGGWLRLGVLLGGHL